MYMLTQFAKGARTLAAVGLATLATPAAFWSATAILGPAPAARAQDSSKDQVILTSGKTIEGQIVEETPTTIRIKFSVAGMSGETTYQKSEILQVVRATAPARTDTPKDAAKPAVADKNPPARPAESGDEKKKVYYFELTGWFGEDISETPIRDSMNDARKMNADYVIVKLDNDWSLKHFGQMGDIKDDAGQFDQLFRTERIEPIFTEELARWGKKPTIVIWVNKAMGGAAFLPFLSPNIYFTTEGKMGGIGHLQAIFGSMGDKVVREKQFALRLKHAEGKAIEGGYDPIIVDAMARDEVVLSVRFVGGKPELLQREPETPDEILLTRDGTKYPDDIETLARGEGKATLTLKADIAYKLGISKGTADTLDDLVYQLGLSRTSEMLKGRGNAIMKSWRDALEDAKHTLPKLWEEFRGVTVKDPGGYNERTQARGRRKSILGQMQGIEKKYEEALNYREIGVPDWNQLETLKKQLELQQLQDKPDKKR